MDLSLQEWKQRAFEKNAVIIDVRTSVERENGYIKEAMHLDFYDAPNFMNELSKLNPDKEYYIYCQSGARGAKACIIFKNKDFENVFNLIGGYKSYSKDKKYDKKTS